MNFSKYDRVRLRNAPNLFNIPQQEIIDRLTRDCDELEKELTASRESRQLSAVPSECEWQYANKWHGYLWTGCGVKAYNPSNKFKFCPFCGKKIGEFKKETERGIAG